MFHIPVILGWAAVKAAVAHFGSSVAAHTGATAIGHAAANAATHLGASQAAASSIGATVTATSATAIVGASAGAVVVGASEFAIAVGKERFAAAHSIAREIEQIRLNSGTALKDAYTSAATEQQETIATIRAESKAVLSLFNDDVLAIDMSNLPAVQRLLFDVSHLPKVPAVLRLAAPPPMPNVSQALVSLTTPEIRLINHEIATGHPAVACGMYLARVYGHIVGRSTDFYFAAKEHHIEAWGNRRDIQAACATLVTANAEACQAVEEHCRKALITFRIHSEDGVKLGGSNRPWSELDASEQGAVATLKTAHDVLIAGLTALVESPKAAEGVG